MCCVKSTFLLLASFLATATIYVPAQERLSDDPKISEPQVETDGSVLLLDSQPLFVRSVQHNGESFSFLKELGFNAIHLSAPPNEDQLAQANRLGIWLICPPPSSAKYQIIDSNYDCVIAWSVGEQRSGRDLQVIRRTIADVRDADKSDRPVVANVKSHWSEIGRAVDVVSIGIHSIGTDFRASRYSRFIRKVGSSIAKPIWSDIQTELPKALLDQVTGFVGRTPDLPIEHQQLKFQLYEAICGGARGVRFLSKSRLDDSDPVTRLRASGIRWLMQHCLQIERWVSAGLVETVRSTDDLEVHRIRIPGSKLVIVQRLTGFEQWTCGGINPKSVQFFLNQNQGDRAYILDERGATLIPNFQSNSQTTAQVSECPYACCILLTQDARAVQAARQFVVTEPLYLQNRVQLTQQSLAYFALVEQQIASTGQGFPVLGTARVASESSLKNAQRMLQAGNYGEVIRLLEQTDASLAAARQSLLQQQIERFNGVVSSPLISHFGLIADHLKLGSDLAGANWSPNSLPGGDFEDLGQMMDAGWENRKEESPLFSTKVELQKSAAVDGIYGLMMSAESNQARFGLIPANPLWVRSADIKVKKGQLVRVHGFVRVHSKDESRLGASVMDSLGKEELALRFDSTSGWQEFTIYRTAVRKGNFSVTLAMTGMGSAMFDEITIRTLDRPKYAEQANSDENKIK